MNTVETYENPRAEVILLSTQTNILAASDEDQGEWAPPKQVLQQRKERLK